ncbi:MAG: type I-E CRISPR-associated protein Cas7/Cse4/CasC [Acidobacteriota bacterium]|nr:type I-E CRISPR-associated protein Cas7/Cse4/CasC [Blastocatellia bacterium]MDW8240444.1 type I-E CRISPR-associated protein Cas7/Cse4/CasC [Acidobacteriota bacterium]
MKLIELHILQSFPVSCLNRDDVGAPKSATFGGVTRARISSQCLKRAIRQAAAELQPTLYAGRRSRLFTEKITEVLVERHKLDPKVAEALAKCAAHYLGKLDPKDERKVKTLMFLSPDEFNCLADLLKELSEDDRNTLCQAVERISPEELEKAEETDEGDAEETIEKETSTKKTKEKEKPLTAKQFTKLVAKVLKTPIRKTFKESSVKGLVKDAADIAIFGRMVASDHSLTVEGAGLFSHALSTHKADNDIDFFSAVDDLQPTEEAGAGMTGTLEFTSATYYRYVGLNLDLLKQHLAALSADEFKSVVETFVRASILAVPGARKNSMNAHTLPCYVLGLVKDKGQPLQLVNAFEKPVFSKNGLMDASITALKEHHEQLKRTWGIQPVLEVAIPDKSLDDFCKEIIAHVS